MKIEFDDDLLIEAIKVNGQTERLRRFAHLCIRIGINDKYALENDIISEEEMEFIHEMLFELVPDINEKTESMRLDDYIGKVVIVCLKDGEKLKGKLSCDSRYLKISDHITGEPFIFYGKDIETIDIMEES